MTRNSSKCVPSNSLCQRRAKPPSTDHSNSGYDYTFASYVATHVITNHDEIASILALRPTDAKERSRKGVEYLLRTVTSALSRYNSQHS
jgi:hypothetical protein